MATERGRQQRIMSGRSKVDPKQEHPWLAARLRELRFDAERFQKKADTHGWAQVADQLGEVALAEELLEGVEP